MSSVDATLPFAAMLVVPIVAFATSWIGCCGEGSSDGIVADAFHGLIAELPARRQLELSLLPQAARDVDVERRLLRRVEEDDIALLQQHAREPDRARLLLVAAETPGRARAVDLEPRHRFSGTEKRYDDEAPEQRRDLDAGVQPFGVDQVRRAGPGRIADPQSREVDGRRPAEVDVDLVHLHFATEACADASFHPSLGPFRLDDREGGSDERNRHCNQNRQRDESASHDEEQRWNTPVTCWSDTLRGWARHR